jgi:hypothetical protein
MTYREWIDEIEVFSTRWERAFDEIIPEGPIEVLEDWLEAAWKVGYEHGLKERDKDYEV